MAIFNDPNDFQKRFQGKMAGTKGSGYSEFFPNKEAKKFIKENKTNRFVIYTDGSSRGNPGPGGWAAVIIKNNYGGQGEHVQEIGGKEERTTNNRMEIIAAIEALRNLEIYPNNEIGRVEIHTDSEYLMKGITVWIKNWQKNNWKTKSKKKVLNKDLWEKLLAETGKRKVEWKKVLGHSGHKFNDRCDEIATSFADNFSIVLYNGLKFGYKALH